MIPREAQRGPLWPRNACSSPAFGTKDPAKADTYYIEALAAPDTINTIPQPTLDAFIDHGTVGAMLPVDGGDADAVIARVQAAGIDVPSPAETLQSDGGAAFETAWDEFLQSLGAKSAQLAATAR